MKVNVNYSWRKQLNLIIPSPWALTHGLFDRASEIKTTFENEAFGNFLKRMEEIMVAQEYLPYHSFCIRVENTIAGYRSENFHRFFTTWVMTKKSAFGFWSQKGREITFSEMDVMGDEELNTEKDFNLFFKHLRDCFQQSYRAPITMPQEQRTGLFFG